MVWIIINSFYPNVPTPIISTVLYPDWFIFPLKWLKPKFCRYFQIFIEICNSLKVQIIKNKIKSDGFFLSFACEVSLLHDSRWIDIEIIGSSINGNSHFYFFSIRNWDKTAYI